MEGELFSGVSAQGMVDRLCELAVERKASDVHAEPLAEGGRIRLRRHGVMENLGYLSGRRFSSLINCFKVMAHMHLEENRIPQDGSCRIRLRRHGVMENLGYLSGRRFSSLINCFKVMAHMHLEENRIPQDGSCRRRVAGEEVSFRFSVIPSLYGEAAVMRVLPPYLPFVDGMHLGMLPCQKDLFIRKLKAHHGLILVTGPTGSGKTSTMYAAMRRLTSGKISAFSIEDPVEYHMDGVVQMEVNEKAGLTFARGLRALMRQDPDIIMVGEIRDEETARIAVHAALSGHLVLSTLHTGNAAEAPLRLVDMGVPSYLLAACLCLVISQRLVPAVNGRTGIFEMLSIEEAERRAIHDQDWKPSYLLAACLCLVISQRLVPAVNGRTGIFEMLSIEEAERRAIHDQDWKSLASGMKRQGQPDMGDVLSMRRQGIMKGRNQYAVDCQVVGKVSEDDGYPCDGGGSGTDTERRTSGAYYGKDGH